MLLPLRLDDDTWEDPRAELVRRLLEYQQIKEIARWLEKSADRRADRHVRGYIPPAPEAPLLPLTLDLVELLRAVERAIHGIPLPIFHNVTARPLDIERATARLQALLDEKDSFDWREALGPAPTIVELLSTFLAILELAKRGGIRVTQNGAFAPLMIARDAALSAA
jgi:segregation and condensation protein A